jgi:hypothetical protein
MPVKNNPLPHLLRDFLKSPLGKGDSEDCLEGYDTNFKIP